MGGVGRGHSGQRGRPQPRDVRAATPQLWAYCANHSGMGPADAIGVLGVDAGNYGGGSTIVVNTVNTTEEATVMGVADTPCGPSWSRSPVGVFYLMATLRQSYGEYVSDQSDALMLATRSPSPSHLMVRTVGVAFTTGVTTTGTPGLADGGRPSSSRPARPRCLRTARPTRGWAHGSPSVA